MQGKSKPANGSAWLALKSNISSHNISPFSISLYLTDSRHPDVALRGIRSAASAADPQSHAIRCSFEAAP